MSALLAVRHSLPHSARSRGLSRQVSHSPRTDACTRSRCDDLWDRQPPVGRAPAPRGRAFHSRPCPPQEPQLEKLVRREGRCKAQSWGHSVSHPSTHHPPGKPLPRAGKPRPQQRSHAPWQGNHALRQGSQAPSSERGGGPSSLGCSCRGSEALKGEKPCALRRADAHAPSTHPGVQPEAASPPHRPSPAITKA